MYCEWQKEINENSNILLREFYLKGGNLFRAKEKTLKKNLALINARHKKVLGCKNHQIYFTGIAKLLHLVYNSSYLSM